MDKLSDRGDEPTQFEQELIANADTSRITDAIGQWVLIAQRVGLAAVLAVMDEFGGEKLVVPPRRKFIGAIYRPLRNELIRARISQGATLRELRAEFGVSNTHLMRLRRRLGVDRVKPGPVDRRR